MTAMLQQTDSSGITRIAVLQGEVRVSADRNAVLGTVLGSCVASCLFDAEAGVGGMNHFLLAEPPSSHAPGQIDLHYGTYLMEMLINAMIGRGARKDRMRAHLYGGANLRAGMIAIGTSNAQFARSFLEREHIPLMRSDLGGTDARRVDFRAALGQVRCRVVASSQVPQEVPERRPVRASGDVELF